MDYRELKVSLTIYDRDAVFAAAYAFTDRCFLFLRPDEREQIVVEFRARSDSVMLDELVGLFSNELIDHQLRAAIARETKPIRERLFRAAFADTHLLSPGQGADA